MSNISLGKEFDIISEFFRPLSESVEGAFALTDDAAVIKTSDGSEAVISKDILVEGVHFRKEDSAFSVGWKLLAVNLSDLASMGAKPSYYLLGLALPKDIDNSWIENFVLGLGRAQNLFGIGLLGGDTVATEGPITLSLTAIGEAPNQGVIRRNGASPDEILFVSGNIGDGYLGLMCCEGIYPFLNKKYIKSLSEKYQLPSPRVNLGVGLRGLATAATDISDGLVADLKNLCVASNVSARVFAKDVPISAGANELIFSNHVSIADLLCGGDDFELLFTVPASRESEVSHLASNLDVSIKKIGITGSDSCDVQIISKDDKIMNLETLGYSHFNF
tara:strand:- start:20141 stop:21139 length:999 start_codon:yes stop_codon:yes gene_type:complete